MTWSAVVTDMNGNRGKANWNICPECVHGMGTCNVPKLAGCLGGLITSIDVGSDGHMAPGTAELKCSGFERKPEG